MYNSHKVRKLAKKAPIFQLFKQRYLPHVSNSYFHIITFSGIKHFLSDNLFEDFQAEFIANEDEDARRIERFMVIILNLKNVVIFFKLYLKYMNRVKPTFQRLPTLHIKVLLHSLKFIYKDF